MDDYAEWKRMKEFEEGTHPNQSLYDSVGDMMGRATAGIGSYACDSCHKTFMGSGGKCPSCGSWNTHKIQIEYFFICHLCHTGDAKVTDEQHEITAVGL